MRSPERSDAEAVLAVLQARDLADLGMVDCSLDDVLFDWANPEIDVQRDCMLIETEQGEVVAYSVVDPRSAVIYVHPDHEGCGHATRLREFTERRARERGEPPRQYIHASNQRAVEHLQAAGYVREHVFIRLRADLAEVPRGGDPRVRRFDLASEGEAVHALVAEAFTEIAGNVPESFGSWKTYLSMKSRPDLMLAIDDEEGIAGALVGELWEDGTASVGELAVARRARRRGYGKALLLSACEAFRELGAHTAELGVASENAPATALYESIGFRPVWTSERWGLPH